MKTTNFCGKSILLAIKPIYADRIFKNKKKFEYRRVPPKKKIKKILFYATSPVSRIVGECRVKKTLDMKLDDLWNKTKKHAGITGDEFYAYFEGKKTGFCFVLERIKKYKRGYQITDFNISSAPQSFVYLA